jgi:probable rRNA maturation factor
LIQLTGIEFFSEHSGFEIGDANEMDAWLQSVVRNFGYSVKEISYVFVTDEELWEMNREHLKHDTYTDIITFVLNDDTSKELMVDIFISVDRVRENAQIFKVSFWEEMHRVMVHGILHAMGLDDKDDEAKGEMRKAEDFALSLREF